MAKQRKKTKTTITTNKVNEMSEEKNMVDQATVETDEVKTTDEKPTEEVVSEDGSESADDVSAQTEIIEESKSDAVDDVVVDEEKPVATAVVEDRGELAKFLEKYGKEMAPRVPIAVTTGAMNQYLLWKSIETILTTVDFDSFRKDWLALLAFANESPTFKTIYIYRFAEYWTWSEAELASFQKIINLVLLTADPAKRVDGLREIDFSILFTEAYTDQTKQNLAAFYNK